MRARTYRGITDGSQDVEIGQATQGVDGLQCAAKGLMEYVAYPGPPTAVEGQHSPEGLTPMFW